MTGFVVAIVLILLILLFRKISPLSSAVAKTHKPLVVLRAEYRHIDLTHLGFLFLTAPVLTFIYYKLFVVAYNFRLSLYDDIQIIVGFQSAFMVIAIFAAIVTSTILSMYYLKRKLKYDWEEYVAYNNLKYGFNYYKIGHIIMNGIAAITIISLIAIFDWFVIFRNKEIVVNTLFGFGTKTYNYTDVSEIRDVQKSKAPNGNIVEDEHYVIVFSDGEKWNSRQSGFPDFNENLRIIELIKSKTGKELVALEYDKE